MKVYIVLEGEDLGPPSKMHQLVYGVFLTRKAAKECMGHHADYMDSYEWPKLIRKPGKVVDRHGNIYFQICAFEVDVCRKQTWL